MYMGIRVGCTRLYTLLGPSWRIQYESIFYVHALLPLALPPARQLERVQEFT